MTREELSERGAGQRAENRNRHPAVRLTSVVKLRTTAGQAKGTGKEVLLVAWRAMLPGRNLQLSQHLHRSGDTC